LLYLMSRCSATSLSHRNACSPASPGFLVASGVGLLPLCAPVSAEYSRAHPSNVGSQLKGEWVTMTLPNQLELGDGGGVHDASCTGPADRCHRRCIRLGSVDFRVGVESAVAVLRDGERTQVAAASLSYRCACRPPSGAS